MKNPITHIIVHCSDSAWGSAREIRKWHQEKGWKDIGYHFVILNGMVLPGSDFMFLNGSIECGRELDGDAFIEDNEVGAHALGYNAGSIGICLVLKRAPTIEQLDALKKILLELCRRFKVPVKNVLGHCETESGKAEGKTCPNFDMEPVRLWLRGRIEV